MKKVSLTVVVVLLAVAGLLSSVSAQRGAGDLEGVARKPTKQRVVSLSGKVVEVKTEPCEMTTGPSLLGTHLIMKTGEGKSLNIHLGPKDDVKFIAEKLTRGTEVKVEGFRTEKTKTGQYIARALTIGDQTTELRDRATLRPVWAGRRGVNTRTPRTGKIAVTVTEASLDAAVDPRFGRCPYLILVDPESESFETLKNTNANRGNAAGVQSAKVIAAKGVKVLLTGKCGPKATDALTAAGIEVVSDCSGTARDAVAKYKAGRPQPPVVESSTERGSGRGAGRGAGAGWGRGRGRGQRGRNPS